MGGHRETLVAAGLNLSGLRFHVLATQIGDSLQKDWVRCSALGAVALVGALAVVDRRILVEVTLPLLQGLVEPFAEGHRVKLLLPRAVETLAEAVGFRRADVGTPVRNLLNR